jgi:hypothetical protein
MARRTGTYLRLPFDWRRPTVRRVKSRWWNSRDRRILTPKAYGWGFDLNFYWFGHPLEWWRKRR